MPLSGFGFGELLLISMLVLIVFGPKRLPEITRTIGKGIREFKKGMNEIQRELETADREARWSSPSPPPPPRSIEEPVPLPSDEKSSDDESSEEDTPTEDTHQPPPAPRDATDPAAEFIDPWTTDSSHLTSTQTPDPSIEGQNADVADDISAEDVSEDDDENALHDNF